MTTRYNASSCRSLQHASSPAPPRDTLPACRSAYALAVVSYASPRRKLSCVCMRLLRRLFRRAISARRQGVAPCYSDRDTWELLASACYPRLRMLSVRILDASRRPVAPHDCRTAPHATSALRGPAALCPGSPGACRTGRSLFGLLCTATMSLQTTASAVNPQYAHLAAETQKYAHLAAKTHSRNSRLIATGCHKGLRAVCARSRAAHDAPGLSLSRRVAYGRDRSTGRPVWSASCDSGRSDDK